MSTLLALCIWTVYIVHGQLHPNWGEIECDMTITDIFLPGDKYVLNTQYQRWYTFLPSYKSSIPRDVRISTCIEDTSGNIGATLDSYIRPTLSTLTGDERFQTQTKTNLYPCDDEEIGDYYVWENVQSNYDWLLAVSPPIDGEYAGGRYKISVECLEPSEPADNQLKPKNNATNLNQAQEAYPYTAAYINSGSKRISCDASAAGTIVNGGTHVYRYEVSEFAQEIVITTCDPEQLYNINSIDGDNRVEPDGTFSSLDYTLSFDYWDPSKTIDENTGIATNIKRWRSDSFDGRACIAETIGDAYECQDDCTNINDIEYGEEDGRVVVTSRNTVYDDNILRLSPGTYYIRIQNEESEFSVPYVLSMLCWNNDAVQDATAGQDYDAVTPAPTDEPTTPFPTRSPVTANPTTANPTIIDPEPTASPTPAPSDYFYGEDIDTNSLDDYDFKPSERKSIYKGEISCGIHHHDRLEKKRLHWYRLNVTEPLDYFGFDTCLDDITQFDSCLTLYQYNEGSKTWSEYSSSRLEVTENPNCQYCNIIRTRPWSSYLYQLPVGIYAIAIYGQRFQKNIDEDKGEYVLRMGCGLNGDYDKVVPVDNTPAPTPAPTGIGEPGAKFGELISRISCDKILEGDLPSQSSGELYEFTVVGDGEDGGGIEWIKFSTCDDTEFYNYLFIYDYFNDTGHESISYSRLDTSVGFHYETDTTCNELVLNDLSNGHYYVKVEGYNYFFDHGAYTLKMSCSDNSAVQNAGKLDNEYRPPFPVWAIILIVVAVLICIGGIVGYVLWKKKKDAESNGDQAGTEMASAGSGAPPPPPGSAGSGEFEE